MIVVVSAMSGVTNRLIEAAQRAEAGELEQAAAIFDALRKQHEAALATLIRDAEKRKRLAAHLEKIFGEGEQLCKGTALLRELTPRTLDSISSLGERLSAPMVAAALAELGVASEAVEATELIVTDPYHGGADPIMDRTRERSEARLRPLLDRGVIPVVTGFIGATDRRRAHDAWPRRLGLFRDDSGRGARCGRNHHLDGRGRRADGRPAAGAGGAHHSGNFLSRSRPSWPISAPRCCIRKRCAPWCKPASRSGSATASRPSERARKSRRRAAATAAA